MMKALYPKTTGCLCANSYPESYTKQDAYNDMLVLGVWATDNWGGGVTMAEISNTLDCMHDQQAIITKSNPPRKYIVRRLTPLECCRLQGFPDYWEEGVQGSDSARYKMWGNGMALPNMLHVMKGIKALADSEGLENVEEVAVNGCWIDELFGGD